MKGVNGDTNVERVGVDGRGPGGGGAGATLCSDPSKIGPGREDRVSRRRAEVYDIGISYRTRCAIAIVRQAASLGQASHPRLLKRGPG